MKVEINLNETYTILHPHPVVLICVKDKNGKINVMGDAGYSMVGIDF
jgi:flavin reductase (DIM6/NTAB) family NADH-FMN oxidoreductase RutF